MVDDRFRVTKVTSSFRIRILDESRGFLLSDFDKIRINSIWQQETSSSSRELYNGQILNFVGWEGETLVGEFIEYKFYLAQHRDDGLRELLNIEPISASGVTLTGDKVLFGKRSENVTAFPLHYELVPSGSLDPGAIKDGYIDLEKQFEVELWEESGISVTEVRKIEPLALIYDTERRIYELCAAISVNYGVTHETPAFSDEYEDLKWVSKSEVAAFVRKNRKSFVPLSLELLKLVKIE